MSGPVWISQTALILLHAELLAEHGGAEGIRDLGLLESALARPRNLYLYENISQPAQLAASYATGIARNHPFVDGNKRAAFLAAGLFLALNDRRLSADRAEATRAMQAAAAGTLPEQTLAEWIAARLRPSAID